MRVVAGLKHAYLNVFPNYRHANRLDGYGCSTLSPMKLGPVVHGMPGLPNALNLENFWQQSKRFASETDDQFRANRIKGFNDEVPHRHKIQGVKPLYWSWIDKDGEEHKLNYLESRQIYCTWYARLVSTMPEFYHLKDLLANGTSLRIVGYDAWPIEDDVDSAYQDISKPFGHERVLYTMLVTQEVEWPWVKNKTLDL